MITNLTLFAQISLLARIRQTKPSCWGNNSTCRSGYSPYQHLYFHQYFKKQIVALCADLFVRNIGFQIKTIRKKNYFLGQSGARHQKIDREESCVAFPALAFSCLPAVIAGSMISCSLHQLHVFPPLARVASFPALSADHVFPVLPYMFPVLYAVYMFSRHLHYLHAFVLSNGFVFSRRHNQSHNFARKLWLVDISLFANICVSFPFRARPIVEMDGKIILSTKQISLEDNKTMRLASDRISRKRYPF